MHLIVVHFGHDPSLDSRPRLAVTGCQRHQPRYIFVAKGRVVGRQIGDLRRKQAGVEGSWQGSLHLGCKLDHSSLDGFADAFCDLGQLLGDPFAKPESYVA